MAAKFTKKLGKNLLKEFSDDVTEINLKEAFRNAINTVPRRDLKKELKDDFQKHLIKLGKIMKIRGKSVQKQKHKSRERLGEELVLTEKRGCNEIGEHMVQSSETTKPKSLFPWSQDVRQILKQPGIHQSIEKALEALLKVSEADVNKCLENGKPNRAKRLACEIGTIVSACHLRMQMNKMEDLTDPIRHHLSALLSIYVDLCTVNCLKKVEKKKKYGKEVGSFVYYILQTSSESLLEVILQSTYIIDLQKNTKYLNPFIRKVILEQSTYHSHQHYLKHVIVIQRVKDKFDETTSAELSLHGNKLKPLDGFHKWLQTNCPKALDFIKLKKKKSFMTSKISLNIILCADDKLITVLQDSLCAEICDGTAGDVAKSMNTNSLNITETDLSDVQMEQTDALYFIDTTKEKEKKKKSKKNKYGKSLSVKASKKEASKVLESESNTDSTKNASEVEESDGIFFIDTKHESSKTSSKEFQKQDKVISKPKKIATETLDLKESSSENDDDDVVEIVSDEPVEETGETEENVSTDSESENDSTKAESDTPMHTHVDNVNTRPSASDDVFISENEMDTSDRKLKVEVNKAIKNVGKFGKSESGSDSSPKMAVDRKEKKRSVDDDAEKIKGIVSEFSPPSKKKHKKDDANVKKTPAKIMQEVFDDVAETDISNSSKKERTRSSHDEESHVTPARKKLKSVVNVVENVKPSAGDSVVILSDDSESTKKRKGRPNGEPNVTPRRNKKSDDEVEIQPESTGILSSKKKQKRVSLNEEESITPGKLKKNTSGDEMLNIKKEKKTRSETYSTEDIDYNVNGKEDSSKTKTDHGTESEKKDIESNNADLKIDSIPSRKIPDIINLDSDSDSVHLDEINLVENNVKQMKRNSLGGKSFEIKSVIIDQKDNDVISDSDHDDESLRKRNSLEKITDSVKKNKSIIMQSDDSDSDIAEIPDIESHLKPDICVASKVDMADIIVSENDTDIEMIEDEDTTIDGANKSVINSDANYSKLMDQIKSPLIPSNTSKGDTKADVDVSDNVVLVDDSDTDDGNDTVINTESVSPGMIKPTMEQNGENLNGAVEEGSEVIDETEVTARLTGRRTPKRMHSEKENSPVKNKKTPKTNTLEGASEDTTTGKKDSVSKETCKSNEKLASPRLRNVSPNKLVSPNNRSPVHTKITRRKDDVKKDLESPLEFEEDKVLGIIEEGIEKIASPARRSRTPKKSVSKSESSPAKGTKTPKQNKSESELASPTVKTVDTVLGKSPESMHKIASPRLKSQSPNMSASKNKPSPTKSKRTPKQGDTDPTIERNHVEGSPKEKPDNLKSPRSRRRLLSLKHKEEVTNQVDKSVVDDTVDENDVEMEKSVQKMTSPQLTGREANTSVSESKTSAANKEKSFMKEDSDNKTVEEKDVMFSPRRRGRTPKKLDSEDKTSPVKIVKSPAMEKSVIDKDETIDESKAKVREDTGTVGVVTEDTGTEGVVNEIENTEQNNEKVDDDKGDDMKTRPRRSIRAKSSLLEESDQDSEVASTRKSTRSSKSEVTPTSTTRQVRKSSRIKDVFDYTSESDAAESETDTKRNPRRSVYFQNKMSAIDEQTEKTNTEEKVIEKTPANKQRPRGLSASTSKKETKKIEGTRPQRKRRLSGEFSATDADTGDTAASGTDSEISFPNLKKAAAMGTPKKTESKTKIDPKPRTPSRRTSLRKK